MNNLHHHSRRSCLKSRPTQVPPTSSHFSNGLGHLRPAQSVKQTSGTWSAETMEEGSTCQILFHLAQFWPFLRTFLSAIIVNSCECIRKSSLMKELPLSPKGAANGGKANHLRDWRPRLFERG